MAEQLTLRKHCGARLEGLRQDRTSWQSHWQELAQFILPRRFKWLVTPNASNKGSQINYMILDSTGTIAARNLAAGMMSGITSPTRPWFKLRMEGYDTEVSNPISQWLAEVELRMMRVFAESNFYTSVAVMYFDLVIFGTAVMLIYEDYEDVIRCYNPCAGEYFLANSDRFSVNTFYREFVLTVAQTVEWFGEERCSEPVRAAYERGGANLSQEVKVGHAIEPNDKRIKGSPAERFRFREMYWEAGGPSESADGRPTYLSVRGFFEFPALCPRWDLVSNDSYGRSPAMDALPDIKQLQVETKRKAQAIEKMVNPPMLADIQLKNQPASLLPGGVTYIAGQANVGFKPVYQVVPPVQELSQDIREIQDRIRTIFHNDLFLMISQLDKVYTATDITARREEKLVMLGPVLERFENEALDPAIDRVFNILWRGKLLPTPPPELAGKEINVEYISIMATAQNASSVTALERVAAFAGNLAAGQASLGAPPEAMDKINIDAMLDDYANKLAVPPKTINGEERVAQIREARNQALANQQMMQQAGAMVEGAQTLSKTDVGGGQNALSSILGGGPSP